MIKKITALIAAAAAAACITSCSSQESKISDDSRLSVVTTIFPQYDFVRQIAGDYADVTMLLKPGAESHTYEPTPKDIVKIRECDLFIYNGGEGDIWIDGILDTFSRPVNTLAMMDCADTVEEEIVEGMQTEGGEDEDEDEDEPEFDEHVWTSPLNAEKIVYGISDRLSGLDPDHAEIYRQNTEKYISELESLDARFRSITENSSLNTVVFGDRYPFRYFSDAYGLRYFAAFPGCSSESEPSARTIAFLIDRIKEENIPAVFAIEFSSRNIAQTISDETGAEILEFHSCHNVTPDDLKNGETYVSIMNRNADNLARALKNSN